MSLHRKRFVYDPESKQMVEVPFKPRNSGTLIVGDLPDFVSPVDGKVVHGRAGLREHNRRHGVTNVADYKGVWEAKQKERERLFTAKDSSRARLETVIRAYNDLAEGRVKRHRS